MERFRCFVQLKQRSRPRRVLECIKVLGKKVIIFSFLFFISCSGDGHSFVSNVINNRNIHHDFPLVSIWIFLLLQVAKGSENSSGAFTWAGLHYGGLWWHVDFFLFSLLRPYPSQFTQYSTSFVQDFFFFAKKYDVIRNMTGEVVVVNVEKEIEFHLLLKFQNRHFNLESSHFAKQITNRSSRESSHPLNYKLHVILFFAKLN